MLGFEPFRWNYSDMLEFEKQLNMKPIDYD